MNFESRKHLVSYPSCIQSAMSVSFFVTFRQLKNGGHEIIVVVVFLLTDVSRRHRLQFNPNLCEEEGVRGELDPHNGLVLVLACGTLHNQQTVCGVFEQVHFRDK